MTAGTLALAPLLIESTIGNRWVLAIALGVCASTSSALANSTATRSSGARMVDMDAVLPIVAGGVAMAAMREQAFLPALSSRVKSSGSR